jgi:hypothetical protein
VVVGKQWEEGVIEGCGGEEVPRGFDIPDEKEGDMGSRTVKESNDRRVVVMKHAEGIMGGSPIVVQPLRMIASDAASKDDSLES